MRIWVDDIRTPPLGWVWCKTSEQALITLKETKARFDSGLKHVRIDIMSLDHDLGGDDTTRPIVLWMCENEYWPTDVVVHSANPVGIEWLEGMIERYKI